MDVNPYKPPQISDARVTEPRGVLLRCIFCEAQCDSPVETDSWGFRMFECHACRNLTVLPLPSWYRVVYWILLLLCVFVTAYFVLRGVAAVGLISSASAMVPGYALYRDRRARRVNEEIVRNA